MSNLPPVPQKPKTNILKKWWFWVFVGGPVGTLLLLTIIGTIGSNLDPDEPDKEPGIVELTDEEQEAKRVQDSIESAEREAEQLENLNKTIKSDTEFYAGLTGGKVFTHTSAAELLNKIEAAQKKYLVHRDKISIYPELKPLVEAEETALKKAMRSNYKYARKLYAAEAREKLWEQDFEVEWSSRRNDRITFIHRSFAANANKKALHDQISETLERYRFKRAEYKWIPSERGYTYWNIVSADDDEIY